MIAPVIVCVVLTGTPRCVAVKSEIAPAVSAANPPTGCSLVIFDPIVWMMRQPPDSVPSAIAACASRITHRSIRNVADVAAGEQHAGDDAHRLLRVVAAVAQAVGGGRDQLQPAEPPIDARRREPAEDPEHRDHDARSRATSPMSGASTMKISVFVQPARMIAREAGLGDRRAARTRR